MKKDKSSADLDISELKAALKIDRHNLDEEVEQQPTLFFRVAEAAALARSQMDAAKDAIDRVEAQLDAKIRAEAGRKDESVTEKMIQARIKKHADRVEIVDRLLRLKKKTEVLDQLRESFKQRNYMLRELSGLYISGYFQSSTAKGGGSSSKALERRAERNADRMAEKRRSRLSE